MRLGDYVTDYRGAEALFRTPTQRTWFGLFLVSLLLLPFIAGQYLTFLACLVAIHVIAATGLNITTGFTGLISIGHAVFLGVGAYTVAVLAGLGMPFWLSLPAGAGLAAGVGLGPWAFRAYGSRGSIWPSPRPRPNSSSASCSANGRA